LAAVGELSGGMEEPTPAQPEAAKPIVATLGILATIGFTGHSCNDWFPEAAKPIVARMPSVARVASLRQRRPSKPRKSSPTIVMPAWFAWSATNTVGSFP